MQGTILKDFYKKNSKIITIILWLVFILWKIPFLNKGIDYTDTGFSLENYENVFYGNGIDSVGVFLTTLIGGIIYRILPAYHLLVYRILHWLIGLLTAFFAYRLFKRYMDKNLILALLLGMALVSKGGEALFSYYPITSCLLMLSLLLLHNGLLENNNFKIMFAGFISGINIFVRLPNLLFLVIVLGVIYYGWLKKFNKRDVIKLVMYYALGVLIAVVCVLTIICAVMGPKALLDSLMGYVRLAFGQTQNTVENVIGVKEQSGHSLIAILKTLCKQGAKAVITIVLYIIPVIIIALLINLILQRVFNHKDNGMFKYKHVIIALYFFIAVFIIKERISENLFYVIGIGSLFLSFIFLFKMHRKKPDYELLFFINLIVGCCSVFGSDLGFYRLNILNYLIILTASLVIKCLLQRKEDANTSVKLSQRILIFFAVFMIISMYSVGVFCKLPATYRDANYSELKHNVNSEIKILRGMKTSEDRASQLNEYYDVMNSKELQNYEVAIFGFFPLGFVISSQNNYFEDVQPCIDYGSVSVESLLEVINEKKEHDIKPLIVVSYIDQLQNHSEGFTSDAKKAVLNYMLEQYEYETYYESGNYKIYVPVE